MTAAVTRSLMTWLQLTDTNRLGFNGRSTTYQRSLTQVRHSAVTTPTLPFKLSVYRYYYIYIT